MTDTVGAPGDRTVLVEGFPRELPGTTVLVVGTTAPSRFAMTLRALSHYGSSGDAGLVVTTTESAHRTHRTFEDWSGSDRPTLGVVDTTSRDQYVHRLYGPRPTVYVPSPGDLEKLAVALSDLAETGSLPDGTRHVAIRSLTPILERTSIGRVHAVLDQLSGLRTEDGYCFVGVDPAAHTEASLGGLIDRADGVLSATESRGDHVDVELHTRDERLHAVPGVSDGGD